jgi:hypothetical protein
MNPGNIHITTGGSPMRCRNLLALTCVFLACRAGIAQEKLEIKFSKDQLGAAPKGWTVTQTNKGKGSVWKVVADATAPSKSGHAVAQTAESPTAVFNLCVHDKARFKDLDFKASFKAVKGDGDQGGGLVWRYKDANNYYVARINPLEDNYRLYKVVNGKRMQLEGVKVKVPAGEWHVIQIKHVGDTIECYLDGKKLMTAKDDEFKEAGAVGLWTKADAQTYFDAIVATAPARK